MINGMLLKQVSTPRSNEKSVRSVVQHVLYNKWLWTLLNSFLFQEALEAELFFFLFFLIELLTLSYECRCRMAKRQMNKKSWL